MAVGRTASEWLRVYVSGYNLSGYTRKLGQAEETFDEGELTTLTDAVKGYLLGWGHVKVGELNGVFDPTATTGLHALQTAAVGTPQLVTAAVGIRAVPAMGDPAFTCYATQLGYSAADDGGVVTVSVPFGEWSASAATLLYTKGWGWILEPGVTARVAPNSATGIDDLIAPATETTRGGYMFYHVLASDAPGATGNLKVQDSDTNVNLDFDDLVTTGVITVTAGVSGIVALAPTATVRRYLRHQLVFTTMTSITVLIGFVRA